MGIGSGYLALCVTAENFTGAMAGTALITWLSSLCSPAFTATQFALLSSLASLSRTVIGLLRGSVVREDRLGTVLPAHQRRRIAVYPSDHLDRTA